MGLFKKIKKVQDKYSPKYKPVQIQGMEEVQENGVQEPVEEKLDDIAMSLANDLNRLVRYIKKNG